MMKLRIDKKTLKLLILFTILPILVFLVIWLFVPKQTQEQEISEKAPKYITEEELSLLGDFYTAECSNKESDFFVLSECSINAIDREGREFFASCLDTEGEKGYKLKEPFLIDCRDDNSGLATPEGVYNRALEEENYKILSIMYEATLEDLSIDEDKKLDLIESFIEGENQYSGLVIRGVVKEVMGTLIKEITYITFSVEDKSVCDI